MKARLAWISAAVVAAACLLAAAPAAVAHSASNSYVTLSHRGSEAVVEWSIALRDLDYALGLDHDGNSAITWAELSASLPAVKEYALAHLAIKTADQACSPGAVSAQVDQLGDGGYVVLHFTAACPSGARRLSIAYSLFFDLDRQHRGLLNVVAGTTARAFVLSPTQDTLELDDGASLGTAFIEFLKNGIEHVLSGIDHLLFIAVLLLPAMLSRRGSAWIPVGNFWSAAKETFKILTSFTLAHTTTLTLATLGYIALPARLIEAAIALTILLTAIDNLHPLFRGRRWTIALGFGLIHGLGFANALGPLALPPLTLALALLAFNLGAEIAQIMVAAIVLPIGYGARHAGFYVRRVMPGASVAVGLVALLWLVDRSFDLGAMPF